MLRRIFRFGLTAFAVFALVWVATIFWWQSINRMPTTADIVTHLFLLPAGMIAGYYVLRGVLDGIRKNVKAAMHAPTAATEAQAEGGEPAVAPEDPARRWTAPVLASVVRTTYGEGSTLAADAMLEQKRPDVVDAFQNGERLYAAPIADIDAEVQPTRNALAQANPEMDWSDEAVRAVALLSDITQRLLADALQNYPALLPRDALTPALTSTSRHEPVRLVLTLLLPRTWSADHQAAAGDFVQQRIGTLWPADQITLEPVAARGDVDALLLLDRAVVALNRESERIVRAVVSADSLVSLSVATSLRDHGRLFSANCAHGVVPGEAAAGVLLGVPHGALATELQTPDVAVPSRLGRACVTRLDQPIADKGKPDTSALNKAITLAMAQMPSPAAPETPVEDTATAPSGEQSADKPAGFAALVTDIIAHPVRTVEVANVFAEQFPDHDLAADLLQVGTACGYTGATGALLAVAVAHQQSVERSAPILAVSATDAQQRGGMAVVPPPEVAGAADAPSALAA